MLKIEVFCLKNDSSNSLKYQQELDFKTPDIHSQNGRQITETTLNAPPCQPVSRQKGNITQT